MSSIMTSAITTTESTESASFSTNVVYSTNFGQMLTSSKVNKRPKVLDEEYIDMCRPLDLKMRNNHAFLAMNREIAHLKHKLRIKKENSRKKAKEWDQTILELEDKNEKISKENEDKKEEIRILRKKIEGFGDQQQSQESNESDSSHT